MNLEKAAEAQRRLSTRLILKWDGREVNLMAGADFGYGYKEKKIGASIVIFKMPELEIVEISEAVREIEFPYLPGYLAYREGPVFFDAFRKIRNKPDMTLVDGNGIAHPRKMGLASYVGVILDICTIGCAKTPFFPFVLPLEEKGSYTFFRDERKEKAGICLRTRSGVKPIFVSPGHRIDFMSAMKFVLSCSKFRIPEPLREAHRRTSKIF
ncbi:MAG: endonuclease V [Candidatus Aminicenantes bacterium]|nr:endonuclease V [Candidatus Aminicenantes bacterium]